MSLSIPASLPRDPVDRLTAVGSALHGARYQTALALSAGVDRRTVVRWVARDSPPPENLDALLAKACKERIGELILNITAIQKIAKILENRL